MYFMANQKHIWVASLENGQWPVAILHTAHSTKVYSRSLVPVKKRHNFSVLCPISKFQLVLAFYLCEESNDIFFKHLCLTCKKLATESVVKVLLQNM